jgi:hypothetical protein
MFACALLSAFGLDAACKTEDVHPNVLVLNAPSNSAIAFFLIRDDAYGPDGAQIYYQHPLYRIAVDSSYLAYDETTYVQPGSTIAWDLPVAAGSHLVSLVDEQGHTLAASPAIETKPFAAPPLPSYHPSVVFFGSPATLRARVLVDDPATLPAGAVHLRVMNAFIDHQPLQVVQCLTDLDAGSTVPTAGTCTPVGAPIAYGDVFETNAGADVVNKLGFYWDAPGTVDAAVRGINAGGPSGYIEAGASSSFVTRIPIQVSGPTSPCASCILSAF